MKRITVVLLALLVITSMLLSACQPAPTPAPEQAKPEEAKPEEAKPAETKLAVGIVLPTKDEPRWIQDETRFKDALKEAGYDVEILFSQGSSAKEKENVEALITKGVKVMIICPQDGTAAAASAEEARKAGVKVISYDRLIRDTEAVDYYVTFDSIAVGAQQGQYLVDKASGAGSPLYLYAGASSDNNAFVFFEGAWGVLQPKIADGTFVIKNSSEALALKDKATLTRDEMSKIIGQITTNWDFNTAKNLAEANLTAAKTEDKGNVFILAPNDGTARAIADAFGADKEVKSFVVTGQDAEKASVQYIIDGKQSMTVFKDVRTLVKDAIGAAVALLKDETPAAKGAYNNGKVDVPAIQSAVVSVDKANVQAALIDAGYYTAADFTGLGEAAAPAVVAEKGKELNMVLLPKFLGILVFDQANNGAKEAHAELENKGKLEFLGPTADNSVAGQIDIVTTATTQKVAAIMISNNAGDQIAPVAKAARDAGISVVTWDSPIPSAEGEQVFVAQVDFKETGVVMADMALSIMGEGGGKFAILSASPDAANQNAWIEAMKEALKDPKYAKLELVDLVYGNDASEESYNQALALVDKYPDMKLIMAPTTVGIAAAAKAMQDEGLCEKVKVSGLGLPAEMVEFTMNGCAPEFALWSFVDLGYLSYYVAYLLASGAIKGEAGEVFEAGRMGKYTIEKDPTRDAGLRVLMGPFTVYNKDNVEAASK